MKHSQATKASWFCALLLVAGLGVIQFKELVALCYGHYRSHSWESVEAVVSDSSAMTNVSIPYSARYGKLGTTFWFSSSSYLVTYSRKNDDESLLIPRSLMTDNGDLVDVAFSDAVDPARVVRYRNFYQCVAWRCMWALIFLVGAYFGYRLKVISRS